MQTSASEAAKQVRESTENVRDTALDDGAVLLKRETTPEEKREQERKALMPFVVISVAYLLFTVTDGAIRMIVLLHAYQKGFSALEVSLMFTLYEMAGVLTNLGAGLAGSKWGIKCTLVTGLSMQLLAYGSLFAWSEEWSKTTAIVYVTVAQMFGGIAKDLTKLGGKTVTKLVTPEEQSSRLFKLVALITGWKNSLKGVGYFLGSALIAISYELALSVMMGLILIAMPFAVFGLDPKLGTTNKKAKKISWSDVLALDNHNLNWLSLARLFLFASRDFWFEVPLPFLLRAPPCGGLGVNVCAADADCHAGAFCADVDADADAGAVCANLNTGGGCGGFGWDRPTVGMILALCIIMYGQVQSWTPQLVLQPLNQSPPNKWVEVLWGLINCIPTAFLALAFFYYSLLPPDEDHTLVLAFYLVIAVIAFEFVFAVNSSIHSFLVVHYSKAGDISKSIGFYYMSNACGRLLGTLGSGVLYTYVGEDLGQFSGPDAQAGIAACFLAATLSSLLAAGITLNIRDDEGGLKFGTVVCIDTMQKGSSLAPCSVLCVETLEKLRASLGLRPSTRSELV